MSFTVIHYVFLQESDKKEGVDKEFIGSIELPLNKSNKMGLIENHFQTSIQNFINKYGKHPRIIWSVDK